MAEASPITPARFAAALQDLPLSSLAFKVAELRNSIAHLDYSNEQLKPFAHPTTPGEVGDKDCEEAIAENEVVIARMEERIGLVKEEVERRGVSWREVGFMVAGREEAPGDAEEKINGRAGEVVTNGVAGDEGASANGYTDGGAHSAWTDGTFQTWTVAGGAVTMDPASGQRQQRSGGSLGDEELRRRLEERMNADDETEDGGMHL